MLQTKICEMFGILPDYSAGMGAVALSALAAAVSEFTPHLARKQTSIIDDRTTRHAGYVIIPQPGRSRRSRSRRRSLN